MKTAAIYARKSTGQHVAEDAKSVTRQVENAKAFAASQGWTVTNVFIDDGVSGAETQKLRERQRMIDAASNREFEVVIMQAQDRFSRRDGDEAFTELKNIAKRVEVWFYADRQRFAYGSLATNVVGFLQGEFAAEYRRAVAKKTHEAMLRKAQAGHVTGGKVFGYDNVRLDGHVERRINDKEAAVVRDIFARYAAGEGFKQIAHALNAKKLPSPRPQRGRPAGWDPGTVRAVLRRLLYRGVIVYNRTTKRDTDGSRQRGRQPRKPESEWIRIERPELRIVEPSVCDQVDKRWSDRRAAYLRDTKGKLLGRPRGSGSKHLLSGFLQCGCGARFEVMRGFYVCSARRRKGPEVCSSAFSFPVARLENVFLDVIEHEMLAQSFIDRLLDAAFACDPDAELRGLEEERRRLATEITNLTTAVAQGGDIPALVKQLQERDKRLRDLDAKLARPVALPDRDGLKAALELRRGQWRDILRGKHVDQGRLVLQHLVDLPIVIFNDPMPKWMTQARPEGLTVGLIQSVASPPGFEPGFQP